MGARLTFSSEVNDPFVDYAFDLAGRFSGVLVERVDGEADVHYGEQRGVPHRLRIPRLARYTRESVPRPPLRSGGDSLGFDLISALRFWLADDANADAPDAAWDEHDRLIAKHSAQEALGLREVPIVNVYLTMFRDWIGERLGLATPGLLPPGRACAVVLSHDVDSPIDRGDPRHGLWLAASSLYRRDWDRAGTRIGMSAVHALEAARELAARARGNADRRWLFDDIVAAEARHGFRSTFFFAATSMYSEAGDPRDVGYDIRAARFRKLFRNLTDAGSEVGLHVGYGARGQPGRIRQERELLEHAAGTPVSGSRHHYWHMARPFWPTLEAHDEAGLRYDSSVAFNEAPGFRLGAALPWQPWNPERAARIATVQVPTMVMDGAFFYDPSQQIEVALARLEELVGTLKRWSGVAAIDWHEYTSAPASTDYGKWGEAYVELLALLAADPEVAVLTGAEAMALWRPANTSGR